MMAISTWTSPVWHPFTQAKTAQPPLKVVRGRGVYLDLEDGRRIIDCISSWWVNVHGHSHPEIARAIYEQATVLEHVIFAGFTHEPAEELAKNLLKRLPKRLNRVFFSDNGSTAVEVALKMSIQYWQNKGVSGRAKFISFDQAYHGETVGAMSLGKASPFFERFKSLLFDIDLIPFPATFDSDSGREESEQATLTALTKLLERNGEQYAAFFAEPLVQAAGGMRICSKGFMDSLNKIVRKAGLLLIYDEAVTGFGRTGDWFACTHTDTPPDIICLAKGLSGGFLPLALTIASEDIYQSFYSDDLQKAFFHSHSYTGNPIACAAANSSLWLLENNPQSFMEKEPIHRRLIDKWLARNSRLEKFRVLGSIAAFDVVSDDASGYFNSLGLILRQKFLDQGFLIRPLGNTIYLLPPYCITADELDSVYQGIKRVVESL
jgi:adenosylmethionine-8-amino-7-oxononanoate aminotransferase